MSSQVVVIVVVILLLLQVVVHAAPMENRIRSIPNYPPILSDTYGGYLLTQVPGEPAGTNYSSYYIFSEMENITQAQVSTTPMLLILEGGPGCSSTYDYFGSSGPYFFSDGGSTFVSNHWRWTRLAGTLYLDAPPGVGFSKDFKSNGTAWTDAKAAAANFNALNAFFDKFPEFSSRPLFIAGISYCGHYIPQLAHKILREGSTRLRSQLKGLFMGSPCLGTGYRDGPAANLDWCFTTGVESPTDPTLTPFFQGVGFMPVDALANAGLQTVPNPHSVLDPPWSGVIDGFDNMWATASACLIDEDNPSASFETTTTTTTAAPQLRTATATSTTTTTGHPKQRLSHSATFSRSRSWKNPLMKRKKRAATATAAAEVTSLESNRTAVSLDTTSAKSNNDAPSSVTGDYAWILNAAPYEPCDFLGVNFLNDPAVQQALHANATWQDCRSRADNFTYPSENKGVKPELFDLFNETNISILVYSGTADADVNMLQTEGVIASLGRKIISNYTPWHFPQMQKYWDSKKKVMRTTLTKQIGGSYFLLDRMSFASVKGAGHVASGQLPQPVFSLLESFLRSGGRPGMPVEEQTTAVYIARYESIIDKVRLGPQSQEEKGSDFSASSFVGGMAAGATAAIVAVALLMWCRSRSSRTRQAPTVDESDSLVDAAKYEKNASRAEV